MIFGLLSWLSSGILKRLLSVLLIHMEKKVETQTEQKRIAADLAAEQIKAELGARAEARKVMVAESGFFWSASRLGRLAFVLPLAFWWSAVCFDSVFHFSWRVAEVPVLREWGGVIVASLFLVDGARGIGRAFATRK